MVGEIVWIKRCKQCSKKFKGARNSIYCPTCAAERAKRAKKEYLQRKTPLGTGSLGPRPRNNHHDEYIVIQRELKRLGLISNQEAANRLANNPF